MHPYRTLPTASQYITQTRRHRNDPCSRFRFCTWYDQYRTVIVDPSHMFPAQAETLVWARSGIEDMLSKFLVDFLKAIGLSKASLVSNSMGASVAAYTAVHYPNAVDRLALVDMPWKGGPTLDPRVRQIQNGVTREETRELFRMLFHDKSLVTEEVVDDNLVLRLRSAFAISKILKSAERGLGGITE